MRKTDQARDASNDTPLTKVRGRLLGLRSFADAAYSPGQKTRIESSGATTPMSSLSRPPVRGRRFVKRIVPCVQLIYCRHIDDLIRFARPIGRYLGLHGYPLVVIDSEGPIRGLVGKYVDGI